MGKVYTVTFSTDINDINGNNVAKLIEDRMSVAIAKNVAANIPKDPKDKKPEIDLAALRADLESRICSVKTMEKEIIFSILGHAVKKIKNFGDFAEITTFAAKLKELKQDECSISVSENILKYIKEGFEGYEDKPGWWMFYSSIINQLANPKESSDGK